MGCCHVKQSQPSIASNVDEEKQTLAECEGPEFADITQACSGSHAFDQVDSMLSLFHDVQESDSQRQNMQFLRMHQCKFMPVAGGLPDKLSPRADRGMSGSGSSLDPSHALGRRVVLVKMDSPHRCLIKDFHKLDGKEKGVELVLASHEGLSIVSLEDESWQDAWEGGAINRHVPLGIGMQGDRDALRVRFDGRAIFRNSDQSILCPQRTIYKEGVNCIVGSGRKNAAKREFMITGEGAIFALQAPHLVLGIEAKGQAVHGTWLCTKDGSRVLQADGYVANLSDGTRGMVWSQDENSVFLKYETGEVFWYTFDAAGNLVEDCHLIAWTKLCVTTVLPQKGSGFLDKTERPDHAFRMGMQDRAFQMISSGVIALVRGAYIEDCMKKSQPYAKRQDIPKHFFWDGDEAVQHWAKHGRMFIVIISYGWLSATHPDPKCFHLEHLAAIVAKLKKYGAKYGVVDIGLAIDYCALWQPDRIADGQPDRRTPQQMSEFSTGLQVFTDMYIHKYITSVKLTCTPETEKRGYDDRGWTLCESILIDSKPGFGNRLTFDDSFQPSEERAEGYAFLRKFGGGICCCPPATPERFQEQMELRRQRVEAKGLKLFVAPSDLTLVPKLYANSFESIKESTSLNYEGSSYGNDHVKQLCEVLHHTKTLKLSLDNNTIGDEGAKVLCDTLAEVGILRALSIDYNSISDVGAKHFMDVIPRLPTLVCLSMQRNPFSKCAKQVEDFRRVWVEAGRDIRLLSI